MTRRVVHPGECVPMFEIGKDGLVERELVDTEGRPCNSVGGPLPADLPKQRKKAKRAKSSTEAQKETA